jgi:hypothetical protein
MKRSAGGDGNEMAIRRAIDQCMVQANDHIMEGNAWR